MKRSEYDGMVVMNKIGQRFWGIIVGKVGTNYVFLSQSNPDLESYGVIPENDLKLFLRPDLEKVELND